MYKAVNKALNDVFFDGRYSERPLYLVLDKRSRGELADRLKEKEDEVEAHCCAIVGKSLDKTGNPYSFHQEILNAWLRDRRRGLPPFTALLYTLSHAAEIMVSDGNFSSANYYQRLAEVTGAGHQRLSQYGFATEHFWEELSKWLAATNYVFGQPTARPINAFKYVSLALSQAIVREADRHSFHHMFEKFGFTGTEAISEQEIYEYISSWIHGTKSTPRLRKAWTKSEFRPRICEAAVAELQEWGRDVVTEGAGAGTVSTRLSLAATISQRFPSRVLNLKCGIEKAVESEVALASANGFPAVLENSILGNFATVGPPSTFDTAAFLAQGAVYSRTDGNGELRWRPKLVVPLSRSEKGPYWVEVTRVARGMEHLVLVRSDKRTKESVEQLLSDIAQPGFTVATPEKLPGLPRGWLLYESVRIIRLPDDDVGPDLQPLTPVSDGNSLILTGGLRLLRNIWHRRGPPVVSAFSPGATVRIEASQGIESSGEVFARSEIKPDTTSLNLDPTGLPASGQVFLTAKSSNLVVASASFLARTANSPQPLNRQGLGLLEYRSIGTASQADGQHPSEGSINGFTSTFEPATIVDASLFRKTGDVDNSDGEEEYASAQKFVADQLVAGIVDRKTSLAGVSVEEVLKMSCVERGLHVWIYPPLDPSEGKPAIINAYCKDCHHTVSMRRGDKRKTARQVIKSNRLMSVPVTPASAASLKSSIDFDLLLDAISFLGSGGWEALESLTASQIQQPWQIQALARDCSWLGHLDCELEKGSGRLRRWSVPEPTLAYRNSRAGVLSGFRSSRLLKGTVQRVEDAGGKLERRRIQGQVSIMEVIGLSPDQARVALANLKDPHGRKIRVVDLAAERLAAAVDMFDDVFELCTPITAGVSNSLESYDLASGRWRRATNFSKDGAYRHQDTGVTYLYRDPSGKVVQGPHELVKLIHARKHGVKLHAYDPETRMFSCRLGCEPVGLLGRTLVASSGELPAAVQGRSTFANVAPTVATSVLKALYMGELPL